MAVASAGEDGMADIDPSPIYLDGEAYERFNGRWSRISGRDFIGYTSSTFFLNRTRWRPK
jgi:hypothetical protein